VLLFVSAGTLDFRHGRFLGGISLRLSRLLSILINEAIGRLDLPE
jgi:hypothetical protein